MKIMKPNVNRALIFQGGGSLGAYEAGAYNAINEDMSAYFRTEGRENLSTQPVCRKHTILYVLLGFLA